MGDGNAIEQRGLYFEEFEVGARYLHRPGRTMTEGDNSLFTTLTLNSQALHLDAAWSATQPFGQRLVNSMLTLSTMVGASVSQLTQGTLVANLGFREVAFPAPVFIGDTLYFETEIDDKRLSATRAGQGIVSMTHRALNQDGVLVGNDRALGTGVVRGSAPVSFDLGPALLFCPADRPERYDKALERADAVILDLEDAVAAGHKDAARHALIAHPLDPARVIVRVNGFTSADFEADLAAVRTTGYTRVMLPKASNAAELAALTGFDVIALCETAAGVLAAPALAAVEHVVALMWGAEDLVASLGGSSSRRDDGAYRDVARFARSSVLLAGAANATAVIDSVHLDIADVAGLEAEARDAVATGFAATACIHPSQVEVIRSAYRPTAAQVDQARAVLAAAEGEHGVFAFEGRMVDEPVLRHARALLGRLE